tara:strand:- start:1203 stop:1643 length:441 start_codon:yes stop_codon:yes gene_type:complete
MSDFISGVANPQASRPQGMTEALYNPPPRKRRPPKTPHSFITGANKPRMTKEEKQKFIEKKREELASKLDTRKGDLGDAIQEQTDAFVTHENVGPNLDYDALARGDIHAVLGDKFDALLQEYGHKPTRRPPTKGTKNTGALEASVN